jgi:integrase/recombinase XerD
LNRSAVNDFETVTIPPVKLTVLSSPTLAAVASVPERRSPLPQTATADLRWSRVEEYFRSRELRPNTRKAYEREFKAFLTWTEKGWQDMTARDIDRYKTHLKEQPSQRGGQRKAATINLSLSALQSLFKWLRTRDYIGKDPMLLVEKPQSDPVVPQEWGCKPKPSKFPAQCCKPLQVSFGTRPILAANDRSEPIG